MSEHAPPPRTQSGPPPNPYEPPAKPPRFVPCSDCRAPMYQHYFTLNDGRPVCAKCKVPYEEKIARGSGPGAMPRAVGYAVGAGLAGAAALALGVIVLGILRIPGVVAIGYFVGKAVNAATGDYYALRYRILAVAVTYAAIGLGSLAPVVHAVATMEDEPVPAEAVATEELTEDELLAPGDEYGEDEYTAEPEMTEEELTAGTEEYVPPTSEAKQAQQLAGRGGLGFLFGALALILSLPLLSMFAYGLYGAVIGIFALGFGVYKAWVISSSGYSYTVDGPYRVGTGPVSA